MPPREHRIFLDHARDDLNDGCIQFDNKEWSGNITSKYSVIFDHASNATWRKLWYGDGNVNVCMWNELGGTQTWFRVGNDKGASATARRH